MSKLYQEGGEQDSKEEKLRFFSFLTSSELGLDLRFVRASWLRKQPRGSRAAEIQCGESIQSRRESRVGVAGGVSLENLKFIELFYF